MRSWITAASRLVLPSDEIIAVINWSEAKKSQVNREMLDSARLSGKLEELGSVNRTAIISSRKIYLLPSSPESVIRRLTK